MVASNSEKIKKAYEEPLLFAHMFEFEPRNSWTGTPKDQTERGSLYAETLRSGCYLSDFFEVMNGNESVRYDNQFRHLNGHKKGYVGLATTALHSQFPVDVWNYRSNIGILLDGTDHEHCCPLFVNSSDGHTGVYDNELEVKKPDPLEEIRRIQKLPNHPDIYIDMHQHMAELADNAGNALHKLWEHIASIGWDQHIKNNSNTGAAINEVDLAVHLKAARGLLVCETKKKQGHDPSDPASLAMGYAENVKIAIRTRDWLMKAYPESVTGPLPIFSYNSNRAQNRLVELTPEQLRDPLRCYKKLNPPVPFGPLTSKTRTDTASVGVGSP